MPATVQLALSAYTSILCHETDIFLMSSSLLRIFWMWEKVGAVCQQISKWVSQCLTCAKGSINCPFVLVMMVLACTNLDLWLTRGEIVCGLPISLPWTNSENKTLLIFPGPPKALGPSRNFTAFTYCDSRMFLPNVNNLDIFLKDFRTFKNMLNHLIS